MTQAAPHTQIVFPALGRSLSSAQITLAARTVERSGVVDACLFPDFVSDIAPPTIAGHNADVLGMSLTFGDPFLIAAIVSAATTDLGVAISTDSIRRNPTELIQTMLHLANLTDGNASLHVGGGETMRINPYGHRRSEGLARMEDLLRLFRLYWENDDPFDFEGKVFRMEKVSLGADKPHRPRLWSLGGGPKLMELATRFADGVATAVPGVFPYPEQFAAQVAHMKAELQRQGRDPEDFDFVVWLAALVHEDEQAIASAFENPIIRWIAALAGRMHQADWRQEGFEPPFRPPRFPSNYLYGLHYYPQRLTGSDVEEVLSNLSPEMVRMSYVHGTPKEVAAVGESFVDAGATHVVVYDCTPTALPTPAEVDASLRRTLDVCRRLKDVPVQ